MFRAWKRSIVFFDDGLLVIEDGKIVASGDYSQVINNLNQEIDIESFGECFILPGFIDAHVHSAQTQAIASYGNQLLDWLEAISFQTSANLNNLNLLWNTPAFFQAIAENGTTTAAIYPSIHDVSVEVVFDIASELNMRVITGKTWMDCNAPDFFCWKTRFNLTNQLKNKLKSGTKKDDYIMLLHPPLRYYFISQIIWVSGFTIKRLSSFVSSNSRIRKQAGSQSGQSSLLQL